MRYTRFCCAIFLFLVTHLFAADEKASVSQSISAKVGWNAIYVNVVPERSADELFANWKTDSISVYRTISVGDLGALRGDNAAPETRYFTWHRDMPEASTLHQLPGDCVLVFKASEAFDDTIVGMPVARQMAWEPGENATNYFGISTIGTTVTAEAYHTGLPTSSALSYFQIYGTSAEPTLSAVTSSKKLSSGQALVVRNVKAGAWSGAFTLSPHDGIDFGESKTLSAVTIKNQTGIKQTFKVKLNGSNGQGAPTFTLYRREVLDHSEEAWKVFTPDTIYSKELEADAAWTFFIGLDRSQFETADDGASRVAILTVCSDAPAYHMEQIPVSAKAYTLQSDTEEGKWPNGLWLLEAQMDTVTRIVSSDGSVEQDMPTASKMPVRLLMYVDGNQQMKLLQRVTLAVLGEAGLKQSQLLYGPNATLPGTENDTIRLSTPLMPVDVPVVPLQGTFLGQASGSFTVGEDSPSNPWKHAYHPEHDGLDWDFKTKAPSGDTFQNYMGTVKPETWSIGNTLEMTWDAPSAIWSPEESYTGRLTWTITGLRHEAPLVVCGKFTFRRILVDPTYQEN